MDRGFSPWISWKGTFILLEGHENDTYLYNPITDKSKTVFPRGFLRDNMFYYRGKLYSLWVDLGRLRIWNVHNPHENYHIGFINLLDKMPRAVVANDKIFVFLDIRCIRCFNVDIDGFDVELVPYSETPCPSFRIQKHIQIQPRISKCSYLPFHTRKFFDCSRQMGTRIQDKSDKGGNIYFSNILFCIK